MPAGPSHAFPQPLETALIALGRELADGTVPEPLLAEVMDGLSALPAQTVTWADGRIAGLAGLYPRHDARPAFMRLFGRDRTALGLLRRDTRLAPLFLFHRDGFVREAALARMPAPEAPFFLAALAWRLNDWAEPVRRAARRCAERAFPVIAPGVAVDAAPFLLTRWLHWRRWDRDGAAMVDALLARPDVSAGLARQRFETETKGALGRELRYALRMAGLDPYLPSLARNARLPAVRAVALRALLSGHASWPAGFAREWVDKRYGIERRVMQFGRRPLGERPPPDGLIAEGLRDKSAMVRRVAADALIDRRAAYPALDEAIAALARDRSAALRERAAWLERKRAEEAAPSG